jgi:hypothetical protein
VLGEGLDRRDWVAEAEGQRGRASEELGHLRSASLFGGHCGEGVLDDFHLDISRTQGTAKLGDLSDGEATIVSTDRDRGPLHAVPDLGEHLDLSRGRHMRLRLEFED